MFCPTAVDEFFVKKMSHFDLKYMKKGADPFCGGYQVVELYEGKKIFGNIIKVKGFPIRNVKT